MAHQQILIKNARVMDPASNTDQISDVFVSEGKVLAMGHAPQAFAADVTVEAKGYWLVPGLVDLSARLREPGFEYKATLESEMQAALSGGVTTVVCPPDTDPTLDEPGLVQMLKFRAQNLNKARLHPLGALTVGLKGEIITEMAQLSEAGCIGFSQTNEMIADTQVLLRAMQYAKSFGFTVWLAPQDVYLGRGGVAHSGPVASRLGLSGVPIIAETIALNTIMELVRATGCRVHLCRLSSAAGVALVRAAKKEGLPVSADVAIHHTLLCDVDIGFFDSNYRVTPPFRAQRDREGIWAGIADGTIDAICSDHTPVDDDAKLLPFDEAEPGLTGLELLLTLALKLQTQANIPLSKIIEALTIGPAKILVSKVSDSINGAKVQTGQAGRIVIGASADLVIVDPNESWIPTPANLFSQGKHTPFNTVELVGRVRTVLVDGVLSFDRHLA